MNAVRNALTARTQGFFSLCAQEPALCFLRSANQMEAQSPRSVAPTIIAQFRAALEVASVPQWCSPPFPFGMGMSVRGYASPFLPPGCLR